MPIYVYRAEDRSGDCDCCHKGIEVQQELEASPLRRCPKCGRKVEKAIADFSIGPSRSGLDQRAKEKGFHKLKRLDRGEYEKMY